MRLIAGIVSTALLAMPATALAHGSGGGSGSSSGVHQDHSPAGAQYQIPVAAARTETGNPGLFGAGVKPSASDKPAASSSSRFTGTTASASATPSSSVSGTAGSPAAKPTGTAKRGHRGGASLALAAGQEPRALLASYAYAPGTPGSAASGGNGWVALIGGGALVLLLGGGGGFILRRRFAARP